MYTKVLTKVMDITSTTITNQMHTSSIISSITTTHIAVTGNVVMVSTMQLVNVLEMENACAGGVGLEKMVNTSTRVNITVEL